MTTSISSEAQKNHAHGARMRKKKMDIRDKWTDRQIEL